MSTVFPTNFQHSSTPKNLIQQKEKREVNSSLEKKSIFQDI